MMELFKNIREALLKKEKTVLVTIIASSGSTPQGAGARMLVGKSGRVYGTIGGALPEHLAVIFAQELIAKNGGRALKDYILHPNEAAEIGAKCGGEFTAFFQYLDPEDPELAPFAEKALEIFSAKEAVWFIMEISRTAPDSEVSPKDLSMGLIGLDTTFARIGVMPRDAEKLLQSVPFKAETPEGVWFSAPASSGGFVYIFGGGHVCQELVPLLDRLGFRCVVIDDREEFAQREIFPQAAEIIQGDFERLEESLTLTDKDYAVIVTRGHLWDYEAYAFALKSPAPYIGVIGSKTKHDFVQKRLAEEKGFTMEEIKAKRVHAPIGLNIMSKTPAEVAVSIAAELILTRFRIARGMETAPGRT
ncbi:MAG: XdhC family protein [Treponema sp.]|jgi:xanthine dehydrogenase accessory factor|nr:XdhC family protein [Treponema sp.]